MNTVQLGIKFIRDYEPTPVPDSVPGSGTDATNGLAQTSGLAQTGDINVAIIAGLILLALTIVGMVAYAFIKNRKLAGANSSISTVFQQLNFSNFSMRAKVVCALMMILAVTCILLGCFLNNAHAVEGADSPLVPDKSQITATVAENGTFTLDTCKLINEDTEKYTIEKSLVSIAQDATDIEGLDQTNLTINGFGDGKIVFTGKPGDSSEFTPIDLEDLAPGASTILTFAIDLPDDVDIETLLDKQVFTISLTPKQVATWIPMQAEANAETNPIDFYPAFSTPEQIAGYKFATYDGTDYHEIQDITSMSDIYSALQPSTGTPTTTLYYQKTSSATQDLKCYTVKDLTWNYVFGAETAPSGGVATAYSTEFIDGYQRDGLNDNGIKTALLASDGFGSKWDTNWDTYSVFPELVNGVNYINSPGEDSSENGGFYGCYGGCGGGLLSYYSDAPWGCCATSINKAIWYNVENNGWRAATRDNDNSYGVVLARAFN